MWAMIRRDAAEPLWWVNDGDRAAERQRLERGYDGVAIHVLASCSDTAVVDRRFPDDADRKLACSPCERHGLRRSVGCSSRERWRDLDCREQTGMRCCERGELDLNDDAPCFDFSKRDPVRS
jgi:hypothetical protein